MTIRTDAAGVRRTAIGACWRIVAAMVWLACCGWPLARAGAQTTEPSSARLYTIRDVHVDVTAESAVAAREQAMSQAFSQALKTLEARLVPTTALASVPSADPQHLLRDFEVTDEKVSSTRYIGTLTVRFDPDKVHRFFWGANVPFSDTASDPILVLPVYEQAGPPLLFEASTPWLAAWLGLPNEPRLVPFIVPGGDLEDLKAISAEQALAADAEALSAIAARYNAQTVLVAAAAPNPQNGAPSVSVRLLLVSPEDSRTDSFEATGTEGEDIPALLDRAAQMAATRVQDAWKLSKPQGQEHELVVNLPISGLDDWIALRQRLQAVPSVRRVGLRSLSSDLARLNLYYSGELQNLQADLALGGFALTPAPPGTEGWTLRPGAPGSTVLGGDMMGYRALPSRVPGAPSGVSGPSALDQPPAAFSGEPATMRSNATTP